MSWSIIVFTYIRGPKGADVSVSTVDGFTTEANADTAATVIEQVVPPDWGSDGQAAVRTVVIEVA